MFKLTTQEIDIAFNILEHHGYGTLVGTPPEWEIVKANWSKVRTHISSLDLDVYVPHKPLMIFAPKDQLNLRVISLLHPIDNLIYTGLVAILKNSIEKTRISVRRKSVFSYRVDVREAGRLYSAKGSFQRYRERLSAKALKSNYVAVTDIADFYPRIYQHRLENAIESAAQSERERGAARVLCGKKKLLAGFSDLNSYGIPVGPVASRILGEAVLADVDAALIGKGFDFVRWVDDFNFFCRSYEEGRDAITFLTKWLYQEHGLTLQPSKTHVYKSSSYVSHVLKDHEETLEEKFNDLLETLRDVSPYDDDDDALDEEALKYLKQVSVNTALKDALKAAVPNYQLASFLLHRVGTQLALPPNQKSALAHTVVKNIDKLAPIADSACKFLMSLGDLAESEKRTIRRALLRPIDGGGVEDAPEFYSYWALSVLATGEDWGGADAVRQIYSRSNSSIVKRAAACALAVLGDRSHAVLVRKELHGTSEPLLRTALLLLSKKMGADERKHWLKTQTQDEFEKMI